MEFETVLEWDGEYPGKLSSQNGFTLAYSPPVEFGGIKGPLSPEDAFVGAANMCYQIVFLGIAKSLGVEITHFKCKAVGKLETVDGVRRFPSIALSPEVQVAPGTDMSKIEKVVEATKRKCPVTNSMNSDISVSVTTSSRSPISLRPDVSPR